MNVSAITSKTNKTLLSKVDAQSFMKGKFRAKFLDFQINRDMKDYDEVLKMARESSEVSLASAILDGIKQKLSLLIEKRKAFIAKICAKKSMNKIIKTASKKGDVPQLLESGALAFRKEIRGKDLDSGKNVFEEALRFLKNNGFEEFTTEVRKMQNKHGFKDI